MSRKRHPLTPLSQTEQAGFIPLLVAILLIVAATIYLVYSRVLHATSA